MKTNTYQFILLTFSGWLGSVLMGLVVVGTAIFSPHSSNFMFVSAGLYGSIFFALLKYRSLKEQVFGMIIMFFLNLVIFQGRSISVYIVIRDIVWLVSLFLSVKLYFLFIHKYSDVRHFLRSFALAFIFGLFSSASGLILFLINVGKFPPMDFIYIMVRYGVLIGFGIGFGVDLYLQNKDKIFTLLKIKAI